MFLEVLQSPFHQSPSYLWLETMCSGWEDSHESGLHYLEDVCWLSVQSGQPAKQLHLVPPVALVIVQRTHGRPPQIGVLLYNVYHLVSQYNMHVATRHPFLMSFQYVSLYDLYRVVRVSLATASHCLACVRGRDSASLWFPAGHNCLRGYEFLEQRWGSANNL